MGTLENRISIDGIAFQYIFIAYSEFSKEESKVENYLIQYYIHDEMVEVVFVPKFDPKEGPVLGGRTALGRVVHYHISKQDKKIVRKHFAR